MAEQQQHQMQMHGGQQPGTAIKSLLPDKGPSTSQVVAVVTLFPVGGVLLTLAGLTLTATIIGLVLATPLFVIFSPVLVPAAITLGLAVMGFLTSGAFGLTALSSLSWIINYVRGARVPEHLDQAKRRMQETAGQMGQQVGQKTKEMGQGMQQRAHEGGRT
ncbi:Oleosin [Macleaya cordata]|uniref:Oleosin n=1 Tax=Macleaya cordata TaxID=56857 RepID=A0A200RDI9_MACCD|nr:Oleosin [Macleaya cordata]